MRNSKVISITLPPELLKEAETMAKREGRTMSELMREAFRRYKRQQELDGINAFGRKKAAELGITEEDIPRIVQEYRHERSTERRRKSGS